VDEVKPLPGARLGDAQADDLFAGQALLDAFLLQRAVLREPEVQHGRQADAEAAHHGPGDAAAAARALFVAAQVETESKV